MGFLIGAGFTGIFALVLLVFMIALNKQETSFEEKKQYGKAEVVGYECGEQSSWYTLLVKIPALQDGKIYNCMGGKLDLANYPKGKIVDVIYASRKTVGIHHVEVHLVENPPSDGSRLVKLVKIFFFLLLLIAGILAVIGLFSIN